MESDHGATKDIAKDFSQMAAGTMSEQASGGIEATSAGQVDQAMTEQIPQLLSRASGVPLGTLAAP